MSRSNVKVICRFRPINKREMKEGDSTNASTVEIQDDFSCVVSGGKVRTPLVFTFDYLFHGDCRQEDVYTYAARDTLIDVFHGYNGTIFAYGQTGAGKTFTMFGPSIEDHEMKGIIPRCVDHLFEHIGEDETETEFTIKCSFLEIYKENIRDLLNPGGNGKLKVRETPSRGVWVQDLTEIPVTSEDEIFQLLNIGEQSRSVAKTDMNDASSRSHSLFMITLIQKKTDGSVISGKLNLADLAGSEKVGKTGAKGETLEEAKKINQSLSALGNCINALTTNSQHIPYRNSKLTFILRESLGGTSKTTLIIACSSHSFNMEETISTLNFGKRAKSIQNQVTVNQERSAKELEAIVRRLNDQIKGLRNYVGKLESDLKERDPTYDFDETRKLTNAMTTLDGSRHQEEKVSEGKNIISKLLSPRPPQQSDLENFDFDNLPRRSLKSKRKSSVPLRHFEELPKRSLRSKRTSDVGLLTPESALETPKLEQLASPYKTPTKLKIPSINDMRRVENDKEQNKNWLSYDPLELTELQFKFDLYKENHELEVMNLQEEINSLLEERKQTEYNYMVRYDEKKEEIRKLEEQITLLNSQYQSTSQKLEYTIAHLTEKEAMLKFSGADLKKKDDLISNLKNENMELGKNIDVLHNSLSEHESMIKEKEDVIEKEKEHNIILTEEKNSLEISLENLKSKMSGKDEQISDLCQEINEMKKQIESLSIETEEKENEVHLLSEELKKAEDELQKLSSQFHEVDIAREVISQVSKSKDEIESELHQFKKKYSDLQDSSEQMKEEIKSLRRDNLNSKSELQRKDMKIEALEHFIEQNNEQIENLREQNEQLREKIEYIEKSSAMKSRKDEARMKKQEELMAVKDLKIFKITEKTKELQRNYNTVKNEFEELEDKYQSQNHEITSELVSHIQRLGEENKKLRKSEAQVEKMKRKNEELEVTLKGTKDAYEELQKKYYDLIVEEQERNLREQQNKQNKRSTKIVAPVKSSRNSSVGGPNARITRKINIEKELAIPSKGENGGNNGLINWFFSPSKKKLPSLSDLGEYQKQGYLNLYTGFIGGWKKKKLILHGTNLYQFDKDGNEAEEVVPLGSCTTEVIKAEDEFIFTLAYEGKTARFKAPSRNALVDWVTAINPSYSF
eukprot:TRINITY_DN2124_c0_g1_i1.p1 TRINITY_DN2124_c0_g1~~TRINITY_DN2124_c0_g1_i1.p1  ORF type:complete len:1152 (-),score=318.71 TRINITY_DN2124_c0_g1_i1:270-3683(-)